MTASDDVILVRDRYYILATSTLADERTRVLKHDDTFAIFDRYGDIRTLGLGQQGVFEGDTRMLSRLELWIGGQRPLLLSSTVTEDNSVMAVDLTNPDLDLPGCLLPRETVHILRAACLWRKSCAMRIRLHSFGSEPLHLPVELLFDADFADMFEVRGTRRAARGTALAAEVGPDRVGLAYRGLDHRVRTATLHFDPPPTALSAGAARWELDLAPGQELALRIAVSCESGEPAALHVASSPLHFEPARAARTEAFTAELDGVCRIRTSNEQFNEWLTRSEADLHMMLTTTRTGPYPYAGVPWFNTAFGRDGIITALETLWVDPRIAAGVLRFLAATQATELVPAQDAEPGKILHETRIGEMAALGEVPFGRYYGTIDATPLFVMLAAAYHEATGDAALVGELWPHVERALGWMERHGDIDGDGYVEYARRTAAGLANQGWKDSPDPISHQDGQLARGPIALCEVQGYAHAAWSGAARLADALGRGEAARRYRLQAESMRERVEADYWLEELGTYALALDGDKRPCRVRSSNAGHLLFTGTASPPRAEVLCRTLMAEESFSGWGVRTLSSRERRYNPMSYHNGSVWPHDNALIAAGLARYGMRAPVLDILAGMFDASTFVDLHRMPELFCGFPRRMAEGPTRYPVACAPQAWAAGSVYLLLQSCLGLTVDGHAGVIRFDRPVLPPFLERIHIQRLPVGDARVDLELQRYSGNVGINVIRREGRADVVAIK